MTSKPKKNIPPGRYGSEYELANYLAADPDMERGLLGVLLVKPKKLFDIRALMDEGDIFSLDYAKKIYLAIQSLSDSGDPVMPSTVLQFLLKTGYDPADDGISLLGLEQLGYHIDAVYTARYLRENYILRISQQTARDIQNAITGKEPYEAVVELTRKLNDTLTGKLQTGRSKSLSSQMKLAIEAIERAAKLSAEGKTVGVPTGSTRLDRCTGGWQPGLIVLGGRPGMGKTAVLLHLLKSAALHGVKCGVISMETNGTSMATRYISSETLIPYKNLIRGEAKDGATLTSQDWSNIHAHYGKLEQLDIEMLEDGTKDINDIAYIILDWVMRMGIGLVGIDYIQLAEDRMVKPDGYSRVSSVSAKLKNLSLRLNIPIIALSQLSRDVEKKDKDNQHPNRRPTMEHLKESGQIEQDADLIGMLYREDYYTEKDAINAAGNNLPVNMVLTHETEINILKHRNGTLQTVRLWTDIGTNRYADSAPVESKIESPQIAKPALPPGVTKDFSISKREAEGVEGPPF